MSGPHEHGKHPLKGLLQKTRYGVTHDGHDIELEFDRRNPVLNAARLLVDGEVVDKKRMFYGEKDLTTTAQDGTEIVVTVDSGMNGELTRAQLRGADGAWIDLQDARPSPEVACPPRSRQVSSPPQVINLAEIAERRS